MEREIVVAAAGPAAQARVQKRAALKVLATDPRCASDLRQIMDGLLHLGEFDVVDEVSPETGNAISMHDATKGFARVVREANFLIREHWSAVESVAAQLLAKDTIRGPEVRRLVSACTIVD